MSPAEQKEVLKWVPLITHLASRRVDSAMLDKDDCVQEGFLAALKAIRSYIPGRGSLANRIRYKIRMAFLDCHRETGHLSRSHMKKGGPKTVSFDQLAPMNLEFGKWSEDRDDVVFGDNNDLGTYDPEPEEDIEALFVGLSAKEKYILRRYYIDDVTQPVIGKELNRGASAISISITRALEKIRNRYLTNSSFCV